MEQKEKIRAWLILRRRELTQEIDHNLADLGEGHHLADLEDLASDVSSDPAVFEQFRSTSEILEEIDEALSRLDAGTYFDCQECHETIPPERLEALPFATLCVRCKQLNESGSG